MTQSQEEALYDFLDNVTEPFDLGDVVSYIRKSDTIRNEAEPLTRVAREVEFYINSRKLAFSDGEKRWVSRRAFFEPLSFVINPSRLELVNGIFIPGHRCVPFANSSLLSQEYVFYWQGSPVPFTTSEGPPEEFYPFYSIFGEEYAPQYVARDNSKNEEAFNSDPYEDPPEVSIKTLDMRNIYREASFVPGDLFVVKTINWKTGEFVLEKLGKGEWTREDLKPWFEAAEEGFEKSFSNLGPGSSTEEQIAYAYWYGGSRMRELPALALEDYLYEKTDKIETTAYGIETRFWYAGREIPDIKELDMSYSPPYKTLVESIFNKLRIPVSEYVFQSYILDSFYRGDKDSSPVLERLVPASLEIESRDKKLLTEYTESALSDFRHFYNPFTDKVMGPIRLRAGELHTAVIDLFAQLNRGEIDSSWLPRHTFIVLSQMHSHTASVMEDMDISSSLEKAELEAIDNSLDSMIETYEEVKELIYEALDSFRRNKLAVIRGGSESVTERLIQVSIGGIDVWRRLIVPDYCNLKEFHQIIQTVFGWYNSQEFKFSREMLPEEKALNLDTKIQDLEAQNIVELLYEYGTKWTVKIMILSRYQTAGIRPVRCVVGAGSAPPEYISGPVRFRRILSALESRNDQERTDARQEIGPEFVPGEFDLDACNRRLNSLMRITGHDK